MSSKYRKRKHRQFEDESGRSSHTTRQPVQPDLTRFIQAHEADLVRGPQASIAARSLEVRRYEKSGRVVLEVGNGLIRWSGGGSAKYANSTADDHLTLGNADGSADSTEEEGVWVDRYDARLLLDALPEIVPPAGQSSVPFPEPSSPGGWSDLPSDAEDTFFFSPQEVEDYRRDKRRRVIDEDRQARLRALRAEGDDEDATPADPREDWGGSDEEPEETQLELMRRTASHVLSSPNPAQLEMRILANHGADPRFAFLRGRWSRAWRLTKGKLRLELEAEKTRAAQKQQSSSAAAGIGGLAGYGDSDEDDEDGSGAPGDEVEKPEKPSDEVAGTPTVEETDTSASDDALKAARRARAREWAEKRRAAKEPADGPS